jgi:transposase
MKRMPSRQTVHHLVNKLRTTGLLIDKKQNHKHQVFTEKKLDDIGTRLQHMPRKSLKRLAQETAVSKSSARAATQLLKLRLYKTTVTHSCLAAKRSS